MLKPDFSLRHHNWMYSKNMKKLMKIPKSIYYFLTFHTKFFHMLRTFLIDDSLTENYISSFFNPLKLSGCLHITEY